MKCKNCHNQESNTTFGLCWKCSSGDGGETKKRIVQIAVSEGILFCLTEDGEVYRFESEGRGYNPDKKVAFGFWVGIPLNFQNPNLKQ